MMKRNISLVLIILLTISILIVGCGQQAKQETPKPAEEPKAEEPKTEEKPKVDEKYPSRTIEYIIGWGAGGGSDIFGRTINMPARRALEAQIIEINMPGGSSVTAMEHVLQQPADGYTVFGITPDILTNTILGRTETSYKDLTGIIQAHIDVGGISARAGAPYKTWQEFVDYAKANPGKVNFGGTGAASFDEVASAHLWTQAGLEVKYIPFEGSSEMHAALLGGHIDVMYEEPGVIIPMIQEGKIQPLLVVAEERVEALKDVQCVSDIGYEMPPMMWRGIAVKKGTPVEIVKKLEEEYTKALESSVYKSFAKDRMLDLVPGYLNSEGFDKLMEKEYKIYEEIMKKLGHVK